MQSQDLIYANFPELLKNYQGTGRRESANFLHWFLENIYRLDNVAAADCICDQSNDKGIDAVYVDHNAEEINFFQSKISQKEDTSIGDAQIKTFIGSVAQFDTPEKVQNVLAGNANEDLKKLIIRNELATLVERGYSAKMIFVANAERDHNTIELEKHFPNLTVYSASDIALNYIEFDAAEGIKESFMFDTSYSGFIKLIVDEKTQVFLLPVSATELVKLSGIADGTLFSQNVRYSLGNTPVNKAIAGSVATKAEHKNFSLYHNGVTLICKNATVDQGTEKITVSNYVVVNGAQSITTFFHSATKLSDDLRVFVKIIALESDELSRKITLNSNNQNSIKPRDLRSNHDIMLRLRAEFENSGSGFEFHIKRGQASTAGLESISNEDAGRQLLAFDLNEPYSCHQIYRVFDDKYAEIFGRPEVTYGRIIFLEQLMAVVSEALGELKNRPMAGYALTKYFLLNCLGHIIRLFDEGRVFLSDNARMNAQHSRQEIVQLCKEIAHALVIDFNYEIEAAGPLFDYKSDLKSPDAVKDWRLKLLRSYEKDFKRSKIVGFGKEIGRDIT
ncbi:AIPR family protein [Rhizobium lentis]|uniref:Abortive phage infection protein C-terminal domain-containing protein n=1 Tax=Rhizobium lentis TaxID=1138194 RepID=A0A9Q3MD05_9HYPH|nr:AIPR family protein [Rhizobium lentis]MBX5024475.1 hypothetical protein [Rhizobium lentis]MBX5049171.1 hypothetical protein [Rhizobium lentis]MBX5060853.1 hypothetical protein [Rhizobium lentis]